MWAERALILRHWRLMTVLAAAGVAVYHACVYTALSMTTARVHYHLNILATLGLIKPAGTRPGPKGITEKLFKVDLTRWHSLSDTPGRDNMDLMLRFTVDLMREHNRQGVSILEACWDRPFIATARYCCRHGITWTLVAFATTETGRPGSNSRVATVPGRTWTTQQGPASIST